MQSEFDTAARAAVAAALRGEMSLLSAMGELASLARVLEAQLPEVLSALSFAGRAMPLASASETDLCELLASLRGLPLCIAEMQRRARARSTLCASPSSGAFPSRSRTAGRRWSWRRCAR